MPGRITKPDGVSKREVQQMAGNAFTVDVFAKVFHQLLKAMGYSLAFFGTAPRPLVGGGDRSLR